MSKEEITIGLILCLITYFYYKIKRIRNGDDE